MVPGSDFRGRSKAAIAPEKLLEAAHAALDRVVAESPKVMSSPERAHVKPDARPDEREIAANTHVIELADKTRITIRIAVAPLEGEAVARSVLNPTKQGITSVDVTDPGGKREIVVQRNRGPVRDPAL